jgi:hypothetical protein
MPKFEDHPHAILIHSHCARCLRANPTLKRVLCQTIGGCLLTSATN